MISTQRTQRFLPYLPTTHNPDENTEVTEPPKSTPEILSRRGTEVLRYPLTDTRFPQKNLKKQGEVGYQSGKPRAEFVHKDHKEKE